jgi:hypothetical protein
MMAANRICTQNMWPDCVRDIAIDDRLSSFSQSNIIFCVFVCDYHVTAVFLAPTHVTSTTAIEAGSTYWTNKSQPGLINLYKRIRPVTTTAAIRPETSAIVSIAMNNSIPR